MIFIKIIIIGVIGVNGFISFLSTAFAVSGGKAEYKFDYNPKWALDPYPSGQGLPNIVKGKEENVSAARISENYKEGLHLIYNCSGHFYACIDLEGWKKCERDRKESVERQELLYPCAPLKIFPTAEGCNQAQFKAINRNRKAKFCSATGQEQK